MSNINLNPIVYYNWEIKFNKKTCQWNDMKFSIIPNIAGSGTWVVTENVYFFIISYHSNIVNDNTQPELPSDLGYPDYPSSLYCQLKYLKWRIVISSSYIGIPFPIELTSTRGDDYWRKVTPFEYELIQKEAVFCASDPQSPSYANTILKSDGLEVYRKFIEKWSCNNGDGALSYVSGPIFNGVSVDKGNSRWIYSGKNYSDKNLGKVFEIEWISSQKGYGTAPSLTINDDVYQELLSQCGVESPETIITTTSSVDVVDSVVGSAIPKVITGYPVFRTVYDCTTETFLSVELISISIDENFYKEDRWIYYDLYKENDRNKCVYYYFSSKKYENIKFEDIPIEEYPKTENVDLTDCECARKLDKNSIIANIKEIVFVLSNIVGRGSEVNGMHILAKQAEQYLWTKKDDKLDIKLSYGQEKWNLDLSYEYSPKQFLRISEIINNYN